MQAMHGRPGEPQDYQALQHFISHSPWQATRVWAQLRATAPLRTGILALDGTGFPKQGTQSPGVQASVLRHPREDRRLPGGGVECLDRRRAYLAAGLRPVCPHTVDAHRKLTTRVR